MSADFLNWPDLQPKIAASIQAGGVDIVELWPGWNYLYKNNLVDLTTMAEEFGKRGGGFEKYVLNSGKVNGRWLGMPHGTVNALHGLPDQLVQGSRVRQRRGRQQGRFDLGRVLRHRQEAARPRGSRSARPSATAPETLRGTAIPTCGPMGPWKWKRTARPSSSTSRSSSRACGSSSRPGRTATTRPAPPGTTATTTGPTCPSRSPAPSTAPASISPPRRTNRSWPRTPTTC